MFKSVLVPVDVTIPEETKRILTAAKTLSAPWGAEMHIATVVPDLGMAIVGSQFDKGFEDRSLANAMTELRSATESVGIAGELHVRSGTVYDRVIALANELNVDLILMGAHRPEFKDYLLGTNAARLIRHSHKSVLLLRD